MWNTNVKITSQAKCTQGMSSVCGKMCYEAGRMANYADSVGCAIIEPRTAKARS